MKERKKPEKFWLPHGMPSDDREFAFSSRIFPKASQIQALYNPSMWPQLSSPVEHFLSFLVSPASLLMSIGLGRVHTGSVREWVGFSPHSPCDCLRPLYTAHSPLSRADPVSLLGKLLTVSRRCWAPRSWGLCTCGVLLAS